MTPTQFRAWLSTSKGKTLKRALNAGRHGAVAPNAPANGAPMLYFDVAIVQKRSVDGLSTSTVAEGVGASPGGAFVPDVEDQCTWMDATLNARGIVISGRFSGCTFARCIGTNGHTCVGHIYVDGSRPTNNPTAQARAFETACGAGRGTAAGFKTAGGAVGNGASWGYVVGTHDGGGWQWDWVLLTSADTVVQVKTIALADWVAL